MSRICKDGFDKERIKEFFGYLKTKELRYSEIKAFLWDISQGSLTKQLRELETDGLINRKVYPVVPPRFEYSLTSKGKNSFLLLICWRVREEVWRASRLTEALTYIIYRSKFKN